MTMNNLAASVCASVHIDWSRDFIADQAMQFVCHDLQCSPPVPGRMQNQILERCIAHLMALCNCSRRTAETVAAQVIAEQTSRHARVSFDMDRSTSHALFVRDRSTDTTRVISAAELVQLLSAIEAAA
jgi:hypothetical protein